MHGFEGSDFEGAATNFEVAVLNLGMPPRGVCALPFAGFKTCIVERERECPQVYCIAVDVP